MLNFIVVMEEHPKSMSLEDNPNALLPVFQSIIKNDHPEKELTQKEKIESMGALLVGLLFGSHDTLSKAYNAILWNLATNPSMFRFITGAHREEILEKLKEECAKVPSPKKATDLDASDYVNHFVKEVLRLAGGGGGFRVCTYSHDLT